MGNILNFTLDDGKFAIKFHPSLKNLTKTADAGLLLLKIISYALARDNQPFYKLNQKPNKPHVRYRAGDSWAEELRMTEREFFEARKLIGTRIYSHESKGLTRHKASKLRTSNSLILYSLDANTTLWYELNPRFANLFCADVWNRDLFVRPDGSDKTQSEIMDRLNELADRLEEDGVLDTSCLIELDGIEPQEPSFNELPAVEGTKKSVLSIENIETVNINGKKYNCKMVKAPMSDPTFKVPQLLVKIAMHDDFMPTIEMNEYALSKGWTQEEVDDFTSNQLNWFLEQPRDKRPGWWLTWFKNWRTRDSKKGGGSNGKGNERISASKKQVEQFRQLGETENLFPDVTD